MEINSSLSEFVNKIDKLRNLVRYQTSVRCSSESVAEHSFFVACYVLKLNDFFDFDLDKALKMALLHDFSETVISDIPHPIKKSVNGLEDFLEKAEFDINSELISEKFANWLNEFNHCSSAEGFVVMLADILSVLTYSKREIILGNKFFKEVLEDTKNRYYDVTKKGSKYLKPCYNIIDVLNEIKKI